MIRYVGAFAAALLVSGCQESAPKSASQEDLAELTREVNSLRDKLFAATYDSHDTAWLTPTEKTFGFLNTEAGQLAVSVQKVAAIGDGSEVTIQFGNLTSASIDRLKYHAQWGPVDKDGSLVEAEAREADKTIETPLVAGSWNAITVTFAGIPPAKLGRIILSKPSIENISLRP